MKKRDSHINRAISVVLLMVFSIALTPFSILHNHEEVAGCAKKGQTCKHEFHIRNHTDTCLICAAHFEKDYITTQSQYIVYRIEKPLSKRIDVLSSSYAVLIRQALRGPPQA